MVGRGIDRLDILRVHIGVLQILVEEPQLQLALREEIARTLSEDELRARSLLLEPRMTLEEQKQAAMVEALLKEGFL